MKRLRLFAELVRLKILVEAASRDARLIALATAVLGVIRAWEAVTDHLPVAPRVAELLLAVGPISVASLGALSLARDRAAGLFSVTRRTGVWAAWWANVVATVAMGLAVIGAVFLLTSLPAGTFGSGGVGLGESKHLLVGLALASVLWSVVGMAVGAWSASAAQAVVGAAGILVIDSALQRLATALPSFRWPYALSPLGLAEMAVDGRSPIVVPTSITVAAAMCAVGAWMVIPLVVAARPVGLLERARRSPSTRRFAALALVLSVPVGASAGPILAAIVPWRMSPPWLIDVLSRRTPDAAVRALLADAAAHRNDPYAKSNALLGPVVQLVPADVRTATVTTDLHAKRAGAVEVRWVSADRTPVRILACTTRTTRGWRVVAVQRSGECP